MKRASRVAGTRCGSYGEAPATCTATGRPWRSQIAMILLPLPRRVGPTAAPFFCPGEGGVVEGFRQIDLAAVPQVFGEALQQELYFVAVEDLVGYLAYGDQVIIAK